MDLFHCAAGLCSARLALRAGDTKTRPSCPDQKISRLTHAQAARKTASGWRSSIGFFELSGSRTDSYAICGACSCKRPETDIIFETGRYS